MESCGDFGCPCIPEIITTISKVLNRQMAIALPKYIALISEEYASFIRCRFLPMKYVA